MGLHAVSDTYSAEKQMTRSLPKMARPPVFHRFKDF